MSFFRGAALVFLLFTTLSGFLAYQAQEAVSQSHDLRKAAGRVTYTRETLNISGSRFKVTSRKWLFRLDAMPYMFRYSSGLPKYDRVKDAVQRGRAVSILYGNCREKVRWPRCDVMQVSHSGMEIVSLDEVLRHLTDDFILWSTIAMACGLTALGFFWTSLRARPALPHLRDHRR